MIFQMPTEFTVPAEGAVPYQHFSVPTNFKEDRYIQGLEARAGNLSVVHHIVMYARDPADTTGRGRGQTRNFNIADGILGALSPGQTPFIAKPGQAKLIKAGSTLVFQMHYTPNGKEAKDRSIVGLIFAKGPVDKIVNSKAAFDTRFAIPANADNYEVKAIYEFEEDSHIVSLMPHMHVRGKDIIYRAVYPDGRSEILLSVPKYNFNWQVYYDFAEPKKLPAGSKITGIGVYDIQPGLIATEMTAPSRGRYDALIEAGGTAIPRWGTAEEVARVVQRRQLMGEPGDGEALAAAGRVLDQVALPRAHRARIGHESPHAVELLVAREDEEPRPVFLPLSSSSSTSWMNWRTRSSTLSRAQVSSQR
jgi:hypothetical protein